MLFVTNQSNTITYMIYYYHLEKFEEDGFYHMVGFDFTAKELVDLGAYKYYKQAITVFAEMSYKDNDLMYFKKTNHNYTMPENILDEQTCLAIYGSLY